MDMKSASILAFGLESSGSLSWTCLLPDRLLSVRFFGNCFTGAAWRCTSSHEARVVVSTLQSSSAVWGRCLAVVKFPGRWIGHWGPIAGPPQLPDPMVGTPELSCLYSHSQDYLRSCGMTSNSCDNSRCQHVKVFSKECRGTHCRLPWNGWRALQITIVTMRQPWFDHLIACAIRWWRISWKLNITGHILYNIFCFLTRNYTMKSVYVKFLSTWINGTNGDLV
jgi:hypothetical protein